jgi:glycosyl transferase family 25
MDIPVFVISLESSNERRTHTARQLGNLGIPFQIVTAVDSYHPSVVEYHSKKLPVFERNGFPIRYLTKAEIGCVLSHVCIYRRMIDENIDVACILEDDNDYDQELRNLLALDNINIVNWELLFLGHHGGSWSRGVYSRMNKKLNLNGFCIGEPVEAPLGTYAYIIRKSAATKLYQCYHPIRMPADHYTGHASALGIRSFVLTPPCAYNNPSFKSTIRGTEELIYLKQKTLIARCKEGIKELCSRFPWLMSVFNWMAVNRHYPIIALRKAGILKNSYAKLK